MRLESFGKITMRYGSGSWQRPYTAGNEAMGFGDGDGEISGEIEGSLAWANYPRRREDGVWLPNVRGRITTTEGQTILMNMHGQSVLESARGTRRAILARLELATGDERYRWLNTCFFVGEGEIDEDTDVAWLNLFVCVNEEAQGPPGIGAEAPERFRQLGRA
jgi:hypothetical protein